MSLVYRVMYRIGFTPWDSGAIPAELSSLVEGDGALPAGQALDIGCGTGAHAVYLAGLGWRVTGIDDLDQPLKRARARSASAGVSVQWIKADAGRLADAGLDPGFNLVLDRGCYHGLSEQARTAYARDVTALAAPGAALLMMAFARNGVLVGPAGVDREEIESGFAPGWELEAAESDTAPPPSGPLRNVALTWYRLRRA
jgi:SAM-dependent methyltransferase